MKNTRKILLALLLVLTMLVGMTAITASADDTGTTVYLTPNSNWKADNARFAVYCWGNSGSNKWVDMTAVEGETDLYVAVIPASYSNIIFCRMTPKATSNNWDNKWNQTEDLTIPEGTNHYTVKSGTWDKGGGTWSAYGVIHKYSDEITLQPTCTEAGSKIRTCISCEESHSEVVDVPATGHNFGDDGNAEKCTVCGTDYYYLLSGVAELCGSKWSTTDLNNKMSDDDGDGVFEKSYTNVPAGTYEVKVVKNGSTWIPDSNSTQKDQNHVFTLSVTSDVTVKFDSVNETYSVVKTPVPGAEGDDTTDTPVTEGETVTVYFRNNWLWTEVAVYYWVVDGESEVNNSWPGTLMTFAANDGKYDVYSAVVPANATGIIFSGIKDDGSGERNQSPKIMEGIVDGAGWEMFWDGENFVNPYAFDGKPGEPVTITDYYLVGYLNKVDDYSENYKFVNGKLTTTFSFDSYVLVKDNAGNRYFALEYCEENTVNLAKGNLEKMLISAGKEVTFTLIVNDDGTLTLSYEEVQSGSTNNPDDSNSDISGDESSKHPEEPSQPVQQEKLNFFQKMFRSIRIFFTNIGSWFKNIFAKKK